MIYTTHSEKDTAALAENLAFLFKKGMKICLIGEMGCGKTAFVKAVLNTLGYKGYVTSPTFALCHIYELEFKVYHIDLYRLNGSYDELFSMGLFDINEEDSLVFIEWADRAEAYFNDCVIIEFKYGENETDRIITIPDYIIQRGNNEL